MDAITTISTGAKILGWIYKYVPIMLKKIAAKIAPFQIENVFFEPVSSARINFNEQESICEFRLDWEIRNLTGYDFKVLYAEMELRIADAVCLSSLAWRPLLVPREIGQAARLVFQKPLTEFEYKRAQRLLGGQRVEDCYCTLRLQLETPFGAQLYAKDVRASISLNQFG